MTMATTAVSVEETCRAAKRTARELATLNSAVKDAALEAIADALIEATDEILSANARDLEVGEANGLSEALIDRLTLTAERIAQIAAGVRKIAALPDPVGEVIDGQTLPNGLQLRRVRVPLGVVAVVYEARPNVTIDAAALCLKSGNAVVLRGSSSAMHSNAVLAGVASRAAAGAGLPEHAISLIGGGDRDELTQLATQTGVVDLIIPRGGEGLKAALTGVATVPVIYAASGNNHVFVDAGADLEIALEILLNAKLAAPRRLQRGRDAARPRRCGRGVRAALRSLRWTRPACGCTATSASGRWPAMCRSTSPPTSTGTPSTCRSSSRRRSWTPRTRRSTTSTGTAPGTRRRS